MSKNNDLEKKINKNDCENGRYFQIMKEKQQRKKL